VIRFSVAALELAYVPDAVCRAESPAFWWSIREMAVMRHTKISIMLVVLTAITSAPESAQTTAPPQTILAIGAHAGDMELTAGALRKPAFDIEVPLEDERRLSA